MPNRLSLQPQNKLNDIQATIYSYDLEDASKIFINSYLLNLLGGVNKIYNTPVLEIVSRIVHPDDVHIAMKGFEFIKQHPEFIYINFRRIIYKENPIWTLNFSGVSEFTEKGYPKRIQGIGIDLDNNLSFVEEKKQLIKEAGFNIDIENLNQLLGEGAYQKFANASQNDDIEKEILDKLNIPHNVNALETLQYILP